MLGYILRGDTCDTGTVEACQTWFARASQVVTFINADTWREIVFTRNASEAVNLVANAWGTANLKPGDEVSPPPPAEPCWPVLVSNTS